MISYKKMCLEVKRLEEETNNVLFALAFVADEYDLNTEQCELLQESYLKNYRGR